MRAEEVERRPVHAVHAREGTGAGDAAPAARPTPARRSGYRFVQ